MLTMWYDIHVHDIFDYVDDTKGEKITEAWMDGNGSFFIAVGKQAQVSDVLLTQKEEVMILNEEKSKTD